MQEVEVASAGIAVEAASAVGRGALQPGGDSQIGEAAVEISQLKGEILVGTRRYHSPHRGTVGGEDKRGEQGHPGLPREGDVVGGGAIAVRVVEGAKCAVGGAAGGVVADDGVEIRAVGRTKIRQYRQLCPRQTALGKRAGNDRDQGFRAQGGHFFILVHRIAGEV